GRDGAEEAGAESRRLLDQLVREVPENPDYRHERGVVANNLGNVHGSRKRWADARAAHQEAVERFRQLAADFPRVPVYRQELANSLNSLARAEAGAGTLDEAASRWKQAEALL